MNLSVLIAVYHKEKPCNFRLALASVAKQTISADEVVIVEDGPIGADLKEVIEEHREMLSIRSVVLRENQGLGAALNAGLKVCKGQLIARMDTDDIALPERFSLQLERFNGPDQIDILSSYAVEIDAAGRRGRIRTVPATHGEIISSLWAGPIIHPAVMYRRESIQRINGYSATAIRCEDYELWFRCAAAGLRFANLPHSLIEYRFTPETHKRQSRKDTWRQGVIGFKGSRRVGLAFWKQLACFTPFIRSLLPLSIQHHAYRIMQIFDPRKVP